MDTNVAPEVLIVGAGPAGMILAHELLRRGVRCRMIEKRKTPSASTRAFTLHARTMEMFDHMGIASRIVELREICPGNRFHFRELQLETKHLPVLDFTRLQGTEYNYYGKVNQSELDQALRDALASKYSFYPELGVEYVSSSSDDSGVTATLRHGDEEETVRVPWLIGADGANSAVRATLGVAFEQKDGPTMTMSMSDVELSGFSGDRAWVNYFVSAKGFMLVTGLPGGKFRLYLAGELEKDLKAGMPTQEAYQKTLDFFETGAHIDRVEWSSTWEIKKIVGDTYLAGRTVLCGDATHVHSPAGGQGMNACMQDAFNLGWKLALILHGRAQRGVLATYAAERRPIAEQVTSGSERMAQILFNAAVPVAERFKLTQDPAWHDEAILRISALSHNYRGVDGINADLALPDGCPQPGDRAPDCILREAAPRRRLYDVTRHPLHTLLLLSDGSEAQSARCVRIAERMHGYASLVKCVYVAPVRNDDFDFDHTLVDEEGRLGKTYGGGANQLILIRPDLYVGVRGSLAAEHALVDYLGKWFTAPPRSVERARS
jgi:2-polyprenyl-6-methoxyphenol hydroxylase-like FAD-dependent oxidoreductase